MGVTLAAGSVLLALGTLTHQPPVSDFDAYARYSTTDVFLLSHLGGSIGGSALAIVGPVLTVVRRRRRLRTLQS